ncbi:MAG TPA: TIGR03089 family protein [Mycobacteriales bacterium]|nr:TIGR03089 family protein [Mycobacteriales bacterium]HWB67476.1 TIGR03089 family protein [Mycobacteriales bacterium]
MATPFDLLTRELRRDGSRPFITWYGDEPGQRVELSVATTANWVAKIAGYIDDELDVDEPIVVPAALHWISAVALLAAWAAGADVATALSPGGQRLELPLDPMGAGLSRLVAAYPDAFSSPNPSGEDVVEAARGAVPEAARVLTASPLAGPGLVWGLVGPLLAQGSAVYCAADAAGLAERAAAERVTHTAGVDLTGLPRLG